MIAIRIIISCLMLVFLTQLSAQPDLDMPEVIESEPEEFTERSPDGEIIYRRADEMPRFPGCENSDKPRALKNACAKDKLINFIASKLRYPEVATKEGLEGMVLASFIVDEKGNILQPEIKRDIGGGCGEEALRVINLMPEWIPGMHEDEAVKVRFNLPIHFKLKEAKAEKSTDESTNYKLIWSNAQPEGVRKSDLARLSEEKVYVRDLYGKIHPISELEMEYEKGLRYRTISGSDQISKNMAKVIKKASRKARIIFSAIIQGEHGFLTVREEFVVR